jgi:hypothetical protein
MQRLMMLAAAGAMAGGVLFADAQAAEWKALFNGKDLSGWQAVDGPMSSWKVEDGLLYCSGGGGGWLSSDKEFANFEIELEFRVPAGGNSGVFVRAPHEGNPAFAGMEVQVLDDDAPEYAKLQPFQYCGSLYSIVAPKTRATKPTGQWQKMHIACRGPNVKVVLNDTPIIDANLDQLTGKEAEHPGIKRSKGYIGLQNHGTRLDFRNIRVRELP